MSVETNSNDVAAEHIQELSKIKEDVPKLLTAASHAISALTNRPLDSPSSADPLAARKEAYSAHTQTYFTLVRQIQDNLMREVGALEDAGVIPAKAEKVERAAQTQREGAEVKNGGLGELDVGWLNARTRDVGVGKAGELVAEARRRLEEREGEGDVSME
ncbi:putative casein kinase substrate phosphoprotein pp28 protein [Neofusicoccum parvum UCRNP2]|uniref:Mediator of RNA polymerase II transcription subunit 11 n=1 Tax=Botryosphaeria parva (strain UCR-NP2) TaxID=1287680 RepID=R1EU05_BOTPV|nr:putative casein kinase substrate phosphoprotein pp28 protein [Neofusicoccum parvum UCRNP2]